MSVSIADAFDALITMTRPQPHVHLAPPHHRTRSLRPVKPPWHANESRSSTRRAGRRTHFAAAVLQTCPTICFARLLSRREYPRPPPCSHPHPPTTSTPASRLCLLIAIVLQLIFALRLCRSSLYCELDSDQLAHVPQRKYLLFSDSMALLILDLDGLKYVPQHQQLRQPPDAISTTTGAAPAVSAPIVDCTSPDASAALPCFCAWGLRAHHHLNAVQEVGGASVALGQEVE